MMKNELFFFNLFFPFDSKICNKSDLKHQDLICFKPGFSSPMQCVL